jgi:hypothetical protein
MGTVTAALVVFPAAAAVSYVELRLQIVSLGILASVAQTLLHTTGAQVIVMITKQKWFNRSASKLTMSSTRNRFKRKSVVQALRGLQHSLPAMDVSPNRVVASRELLLEREMLGASTAVATATGGGIAGAHIASFPLVRGKAARLFGFQSPHYERMGHQSSVRVVPLGASDNGLRREIKLAENWWLESQCQQVMKEGSAAEGGDFRDVYHAIPMINVVQRSTRDDRELLLLIDAIQVACKAISRKVTDSGSRSNVNESENGWDAGIGNGRGTLRDDVQGAKSTNGRQKRQLDLLANQIFAKALFYSHCCCVLVSSETSEPLIVPERMAGYDAYIYVYILYIYIFSFISHGSSSRFSFLLKLY